MGSTSQVTNCDWFIHETGKGVCVGRECPGHWPGNQSNLSSDILAGLGKGWKSWGNPYSRIRSMVVSPVFSCGYSCTLCVESFDSVKSFGMEPIVPSSISIVVLMMIWITYVEHLSCYHEPLMLILLMMNHGHVILLMNHALLCKCTNAF